MSTRKELVEAVGARYRAAGRADRATILDEFVALTGHPSLMPALGISASRPIQKVNRIPCICETGSNVREALLDQQFPRKNHAYEFGVERQDIDD